MPQERKRNQPQADEQAPQDDRGAFRRPDWSSRDVTSAAHEGSITGEAARGVEREGHQHASRRFQTLRVTADVGASGADLLQSLRIA